VEASVSDDYVTVEKYDQLRRDCAGLVAALERRREWCECFDLPAGPCKNCVDDAALLARVKGPR
jgi:hypothetical protein